IRHRTSRRLRHVCMDLTHEIPPTWDIVIRALPASAQASSAALENALRSAVHRVRKKLEKSSYMSGDGCFNSEGEARPKRRVSANPLVKAVRFYQKHVSPLKTVSTCRFEPTCSAYALEAVSIHGAVRGAGLAAARLVKCGPWHPGGFDPVPKK